MRLGAIQYLNAKPLTAYLKEVVPECEILEETPSRLAGMLCSGEIELGLVPSLAYLSLEDGWLVPDIAICSHGEVRSVLLFSRTPLEEIRTLAGDVHSLTSVALARLLCQARGGVDPRVIPGPPELQELPADAEALVLIGDPAMKMDRGLLPFTFDLGREWQEWTGLPFVYALWMCRDRSLGRFLAPALREAKRRGLQSLERLARVEAGRLGLSPEACREYLTVAIQYDLGPSEIEGLRLFYELCARQGRRPRPGGIRFVS